MRRKKIYHNSSICFKTRFACDRVFYAIDGIFEQVCASSVESAKLIDFLGAQVVVGFALPVELLLM